MSKKETSGYLKEVIKGEDEVTRKTLSQFDKEFEFYERSINLVYDITVYLCGLTKSKSFSGSKSAIHFMLPRLLGTMQSIRLLNLKGYYYDESILGRSFFENLGLCAYLARNEEEAENWFAGKAIHVPKIRLYTEFDSFLNEKMEEYEKKEGQAEYGRLSYYVHADMRAIIPSFFRFGKVDFNKRRASMMFPPFYKKDEVSPVALFPIALLVVILKVFKDELGNKWAKKILNILREYKKYAKMDYGQFNGLGNEKKA
jgi:hypothetical protein